MKAIFYFIILSVAISDFGGATEYMKNPVTLGGNVKSPGNYEIDAGETVGQFISRHGGVPASAEMVELFKRGKVVQGVTIYLNRGGSSIGLKIEAGQSSFFNTVQLRSGDTVYIKFDHPLLWVGFTHVIPLNPVGSSPALRQSDSKAKDSESPPQTIPRDEH